jgi:hypothetical protein
MYPYLPGPASALAVATVLHDRGVAEAAARSTASRAAQRRARRPPVAAKRSEVVNRRTDAPGNAPGIGHLPA